MIAFKIFKEVLEIIFGVAIIVIALVWDVLDAWIAFLGVGLIAWAVYEISKELRDSKGDGDVAAMAAERERIERGE